MLGHAPMHGDCGRAPSAPQLAPSGAGSDFMGEAGLARSAPAAPALCVGCGRLAAA